MTNTLKLFGLSFLMMLGLALGAFSENVWTDYNAARLEAE